MATAFPMKTSEVVSQEALDGCTLNSSIVAFQMDLIGFNSKEGVTKVEGTHSPFLHAEGNGRCCLARSANRNHFSHFGFLRQKSMTDQDDGTLAETRPAASQPF
jgi:hypothetical protein